MASRQGQKIKLICLAQIFEKYTDEENPLTATALCDRLAKMGVTAERKAIYDDIEQLNLCGYDIVQSHGHKRGFFLASRDFELPEIYLLADAVRSAKFISAKKTRELISKLDGMLSVGQAQSREKHIYFDGERKCDNEEIYYLIDGINSAIELHKKIAFKYSVRELDQNRQIIWKIKEMKISPYAMTWQDDHYYLISNNEKYDNILHLRIDRMHKLKILEEDIRPYSEVTDYTDHFDIADYTSKLFQMHSGPLKTIELRCSRSIFEPILDRFSNNIFIKNVSETHFEFSINVALSEALISWILSYGNKIEVLSPEDIREKVKERAHQVLSVYS